MTGALQLNGTRLALALASGNRRRTVRAAPDDLVQGHLALVAVGQANDNHAEMEKIRNDREQGDFLPSMLCRSRCKGTPTLP